MFESSQSTEKLDAALARIQGEMKPAIKTSDNPFFKSRYADLAAVWEVARPVLSKYGVSVTQWPVASPDGRLTLVTRVALGGEWMRATFSIPVVKQDPQGFGSATTYIRRFALMAALSIAAEDDDGNAASHPSRAAVAEVTAGPNEAAMLRQEIEQKLFCIDSEQTTKTINPFIVRAGDNIKELNVIKTKLDKKISSMNEGELK